MKIAIIDYGMGNLRSVQKAFEKIGCTASVISTPFEMSDASAIVLPGVGAFRNCYQNLERQGFIEPLLATIRKGKPFLGICLGMQILFSYSEEFGRTPGLNLIRGKVVRFTFPEQEIARERVKIPHMGWNSLRIRVRHPCLEAVSEGSYFYFVHSYYVVPEDPEVITTTTEYGGQEFASSVARGNLFACQFHPEKSQTVGLRLLKNFVAFASRN